MPTEILPPIRETTEDYDKLEEVIAELFKQQIYLPLVAQLPSEEKILTNSVKKLADAIKTGRLVFYRGEFKGKLSASLTRELKALGATWDRRQGVFKISLSNLPDDIKEAISVSQTRFEKVVAKIEKQLAEMVPEEIAEKLQATGIFDQTIWKIDSEIKKSLKGFVISPELSKADRVKIAREYNNNMKLYIKDWTEKEIKELRSRVAVNFDSGVRYEGLIKTIQESYDVSRRKAKFLARQETSLLMTKFKETRYLDAGVDEYKWVCVAGSTNHPVRPMHKRLDGKVFKWNNPPITDENGSRNNPGQDFNCRCVARPIVRF